MSNSIFNDDNILTRVDGRRTRSIPIEKKSSESSAQNEPATPASTLPDGFPTHVHCRWCDSIIKDVYIPQFKNGRNGKPFDVVVGYEPCQNCRNKWNTMVIFIEVTNIEPYPDCLPIDEDIREITDGYIDPVEEPEKYKKRVVEERYESNDLGEGVTVQYEKIYFYPTGRYTGVTLEAVRQYFTGDTSSIHNGSVIYLETEMFEKAFEDYFK